MNAPRILVVDDEEGIRFAVRDFLEASGYDVTEADSCRAARDVLQHSAPDAVILYYRLRDGTSLDLIPHIKRPDDDIGLIVLTGHGSIDLWRGNLLTNSDAMHLQNQQNLPMVVTMN